jgi:hypothetical protein
MRDLPDIRPYPIRAAIEVHTFRLPLYRRLADALRRALIAFVGH